MSIEQLRRQRGAIKAKLTATENFANRISENLEGTTKEEIESRLQKLEEHYGRFQAISQQVLSISDEAPDQGEINEETEFEERYFAVKASLGRNLQRLKTLQQASTSDGGTRVGDNALERILEQQLRIFERLSERSGDGGSEAIVRILERQGEALTRMSASSGTPREARVKLPTIKLPTFSGDIEEWKRYADTFQTLIHDSDLSNVQKHQYLVGSLSGAAARVIESIQISDRNYEIAWELLKKRYEDERAIRKRHVHCLFELPRVHRESAVAIRELVDHVQKHLRILHSMNLPTESWGELIVYLIERNLDNATRRRWEEYAEALEKLTTDTLIEFLQRRCQILERASLNDDSGDVAGRSRFNTGKKNENSETKSSSHLRSQTKTALSTTVQGGRCYYCQGQHLIYTCIQFLNLSVKD